MYLLIAYWQHLLPNFFFLLKILLSVQVGAHNILFRVCTCVNAGDVYIPGRKTLSWEQLWFIHGHSSSNGVRDCFILNSCLIIKLWLDKFRLYRSDRLPSQQRMAEPNNTMGRLIETSRPFEVSLYFYYQVNVQLYMQ